jgi:hypothetical protein
MQSLKVSHFGCRCIPPSLSLSFPHTYSFSFSFRFFFLGGLLSVQVTHLESGRLLQSVALHHDVLTCLALATEGPRAWLVTASCDCTVPRSCLLGCSTKKA